MRSKKRKLLAQPLSGHNTFPALIALSVGRSNSARAKRTSSKYSFAYGRKLDCSAILNAFSARRFPRPSTLPPTRVSRMLSHAPSRTDPVEKDIKAPGTRLIPLQKPRAMRSSLSLVLGRIPTTNKRFITRIFKKALPYMVFPELYLLFNRYLFSLA